MNPIGPIQWPIQIRDSKVRQFDLYYFEFESSRYIVGIVGDVKDQPIPLRIESACIFGHVFRGLKCDCGEQFEIALEEMIQRNQGIVMYAVDDDARGHGIRMHFELYAYRQHEGLQDERKIFDRLEKEFDARDYTPVIEILDYFDITNVQLMTNNPERVDVLTDAGVQVSERIPVEPEITEYNETLLLQEKEWLDYQTSYKTLDEWRTRFDEQQKRQEGEYGYMITRDHTTMVSSAFFDEKPETLDLSADDSSFMTLLANFEPPEHIRDGVDKVVILNQAAH